MKAFTSAVALATLLSAASAATVTMKETPCLSRTELETFTIEVGSLQVKSLESVCGLTLISAEGVDVKSLSCRAFKDAAGQEPGSAVFTFDNPALIATNPVQEGSIKCTISSASNKTGTPTTTAGLVTASTLVTAASSGTGVPSPSGNSTVPSVPSLTPTVSGTAAPVSSNLPGAGAQVGVSVGALVAAFAAVLL